MKEATGELNMTVITVVAIAAIAAFFYVFVWPGIRVSIANNNCAAECGKNSAGTEDHFKEAVKGNFKEGSDYECKCKAGALDVE